MYSNLPVGTYQAHWEIQYPVASSGFVRGYQEVAATGYARGGLDAADVQWDFVILPFEEATKPKKKKNPNGYRARQRKNRQTKREDR